MKCNVCGGIDLKDMSYEQYESRAEIYPKRDSQGRKYGTPNWSFHGRSSGGYPLLVKDAKKWYKEDQPVVCKNCGKEQYRGTSGDDPTELLGSPE